MKIRTLGAELFHVNGRTDGQTDTTNLTVDYHNFGNAPKMQDFPFVSSFTNCVFRVFIRGLFTNTRDKFVSTGIKDS